VTQLLSWAEDPAAAATVGRRGHALAVAELDWSTRSADFVAALEQVVARR